MKTNVDLKFTPKTKRSTANDKDDLRLPSSLLTAEEHKELRALLEECKKDKISREVPIASTPLADERHPYFPVYDKLAKIAKRHTDASGEEVCPLCGEPLTDENRITKKYKSCICNACKLKICLQNRIPGIDNTRGYRHWKQTCVVCGIRMAVPYCGGMCLACYRMGERYHTKNPEDLIKIRGLVNYSDNVLVGETPIAKGFWFVRRSWVRSELPESSK